MLSLILHHSNKRENLFDLSKKSHCKVLKLADMPTDLVGGEQRIAEM
jgi:hypothetical protein